MMRVYIKLFFITGLLNFGSNLMVHGQEIDTLDQSSKTFLVLPIINNNPAMKTGFGAMGMYFFKFNKEDEISPPSLIALYAMYTTNKSHLVVPTAKLFWDEDKNRATVALGNVRINNDFVYDSDGMDIELVFSELRKLITLEYSRKIIGDFYLGMLYLGTQTNYKFDQGSDAENDFTRELFENNGITDNFVSSIGLNISYDSRDYVYYPTRGLMFSIRPKLNADWLGSDNDYIDTDYAFSYFIPMAANQVLGISVSGGFATGDVPFDGYQNYGIRNSLRAYPTGKYKGRNMIASQVEYRWSFYKKWGSVFFAGTGSVWGNDNNSDEGFFERTWLPSAGLGLRYMVSPKKKINLRLDYAWGVDGNQGVYFGVMESF